LEDERRLIDSKGLHDVTHPHNGHQEKESQAVGRNWGAAGQTQHLKFQVLQLLLKDSVTITAISHARFRKKMEWKAAHSTCQVQSELFGAHLSAEIRLISELQMGGINRRVINRTSKNFIAE
jgi:hypothetical protein